MLYSHDKALEIGLIDKVVNPEDLETVALEEMTHFLKIPGWFDFDTDFSFLLPAVA